MKKEEKDALMKDMFARLPYGFKVHRFSDNVDIDIDVESFSHFLECTDIDEFKPYLRPYSSMTKEEIDTYRSLCEYDDCNYTGAPMWFNTIESFDYLYSINIDIRNFIDRGLALMAPEDMYK